ncbi:MAG: hypothetical protein ACTHJQ_25450 [Rhizobiaceae bacterium]
MFYLLGAMIDPPTWLAALAAIWFLKKGPIIVQYLFSAGVYIAAVAPIAIFASTPPVNVVTSASFGIAATVVWLSFFRTIGWMRRRITAE